MKTLLRNSQKTHINIPKEIWKDELEESKDAGAYDQTNKMVSEDKNSKLRKLIRKTIRQ